MEQFHKLDLVQQRDLQRVLDSINQINHEKYDLKDLKRSNLPKMTALQELKVDDINEDAFRTKANLMIKLYQNRKEIALVKELQTRSQGLTQLILMICLFICLL